MQKKGLFLFSVLTFLLLLCFQGRAEAMAEGREVPVLSITGAVKQPLHLTMRDLENLQWVTLRYHVRTREGKAEGEVCYRGVPLKTLLDLAWVQKEEDALFFKPVDLAIVVKNKAGNRTALSWGEVFNRNPAEVIIALSTPESNGKQQAEAPQQPPGVETEDETLEREFPRLVIVHDLSSDRSLKEVAQVEALNLTAGIPFEKSNSISSSQLEVTGTLTKPFISKELSQFPRIDVQTRVWEKGKDSTVKQTLNGVSLRVLLGKAGVNQDPNTVIILSAADGYRSLVSYGELFLSTLGERMIIADKADNEPLKKYGKFEFVPPDDLSPGRWVKAVSRIEVVKVLQPAKLFVIGMGCGDTNLLTLEAITALGKAEVYIGPKDIIERFSWYVGDKPVLFDQRFCVKGRFDHDHPDLSAEERERLLQAEQDKHGAIVKETLLKGQNVALLDYGDPMIYGTWRWLKKYIPEDQIEVLPGIGSFNAANALMKKSINCTSAGMGSVVIATSKGLKMHEALVKVLADHGDTVAIFMGLQNLKELSTIFQKYYEDTTPVGLAYNVGMSEKEKVVWTTLGQAATVAEQEKEKFLGLIYIGKCLGE